MFACSLILEAAENVENKNRCRKLLREIRALSKAFSEFLEPSTPTRILLSKKFLYI